MRIVEKDLVQQKNGVAVNGGFECLCGKSHSKKKKQKKNKKKTTSRVSLSIDNYNFLDIPTNFFCILEKIVRTATLWNTALKKKFNFSTDTAHQNSSVLSISGWKKQ